MNTIQALATILIAFTEPVSILGPMSLKHKINFLYGGLFKIIFSYDKIVFITGNSSIDLLLLQGMWRPIKVCFYYLQNDGRVCLINFVFTGRRWNIMTSQQ